MPVEKPEESQREPHLVVCEGEDAEDEKRNAKVLVKTEPLSSSSGDSIYEQTLSLYQLTRRLNWRRPVYRLRQRM